MSFANREIEIVLLLPLQSVCELCVCVFNFFGCDWATDLIWSDLSKIFNRSDKSRRHVCLVLIPWWCWERLKAWGEGDNRGWDGWMASPTGWTWVWVNSGSWWWTGKLGMLRFMGSQRVRHDWATELNWIEAPYFSCGGEKGRKVFICYYPRTTKQCQGISLFPTD